MEKTRGATRVPPTGAILVGALLLASLMSACQGKEDGAVSVLLVGDIMLGRQVAPVVAADPHGLFEDVRSLIGGSDLAMGNLESPLTLRAHQSAGPYSLEADPAVGALLAAAGFDVMALANNHAGDAGPESVIDTIEAVRSAGMRAVGGGAGAAEAGRPVYLEARGLRVAVLAFDATGAGMTAGPGPGIVTWDAGRAKKAVRSAAANADVVVVSLHGGVEYLPEADPRMTALGELLVGWGADVVWGHGAHVVQPVAIVPVSRGRSAVVATSLGNFLFDQRGPLTGQGAVLEVLADRSGVIAYRVGTTSHIDLRVRFVGWELPEGDAALVGGEWWSLVRAVGPLADRSTTPEVFDWGTVVSASTGRVTGSEQLETVVSFRAVPGPNPVRDGFQDLRWVDADGRSAHLGIYRADDMTPVWVAGMVPAPIAEVVACDGSLALAYSPFDDPTVVATGAAVWRPIGLDAVDSLPGPGAPTCADVDGDGILEPVILERR
jgi:poly-gamma-glutamate capsule biosynthesis protein CapA/YwtB (metallophosphatase superfamily)